MNVSTASPPRFHRWIAGAALLWNLIGVMAFLMQIRMGAAQVAALSPLERAVYDTTPAWVTVAFGVAVVTGVLGSVGLLLRQRWAVALLTLSLIAVLVQVTGAYLFTPAWQANGPAGLAMPILLVVIGALLVSYANRVTA